MGQIYKDSVCLYRLVSCNSWATPKPIKTNYKKIKIQIKKTNTRVKITLKTSATLGILQFELIEAPLWSLSFPPLTVQRAQSVKIIGKATSCLLV